MSCSTCRDEFAGYKINGEIICKSCSATVSCSECKTDLYSVITSYEKSEDLSNRINEDKPFPQHSINAFATMRKYSQLFDARSSKKHVKYYFQSLKRSFSSKGRSRVICKSCVKNQAKSQMESFIGTQGVRIKPRMKIGKCKIACGMGHIEDKTVFENIISYLNLPECIPILCQVNSTWKDYFVNCTNWTFFTHFTFNEKKIPRLPLKYTSIEKNHRDEANEEWTFSDQRIYHLLKYFTKFSGFKGFTNLKHIRFPSKFQNITDFGLIFLISMCDASKLESVDISACSNITWMGLTYLLNNTKLKSLTLGGTKQITTFFKFLDDFSKISNLSKITELHFYNGGKLPLSILEGLFKCTNLKALSIVDSTLYYKSGSTLMLPKLDKVTDLNLMRTTIPLRSSLVEILPNFPNVENLHVSYLQRVSFAAKVSMFAKCGHEFVNDIMEHLQYNLFAPDQLVVKKGDVGKEMYFISKGTVLVVGDSGEIYARLTKGDFFGEIALLFDTPRTASIRVADDECEIYVLNKSDLFRVMRVHPHSSSIIKGEAHSRLQALESKNVKVVKKKATSKKEKKKKEKEKEDVPIMNDKQDLFEQIAKYKNLQSLYINGTGYDLRRLMTQTIPKLTKLELLDLSHASATIGTMPLPLSEDGFSESLKSLFLSLKASEYTLTSDEALVGIANSYPSLVHFGTDDEFSNSQVANFLKFYPNLKTLSMPNLKKGAKAILDYLKLNNYLTYLDVHSSIFPEQLISFCEKYFTENKQCYPLQSLILPESAWNTKQIKQLLKNLLDLKYILVKNSISEPIDDAVIQKKYPSVYVNQKTVRQLSSRSRNSKKRISLKKIAKLAKSNSKKNLLKNSARGKHSSTSARLSIPTSLSKSRSINQSLSSFGKLNTNSVESKSRDSSPRVIPALPLNETNMDNTDSFDLLSSSRYDKMLEEKEAEIKKLQEQHRNVMDRLHADYSNQINGQMEQIKELRAKHAEEIAAVEEKLKKTPRAVVNLTCSGAGSLTVTMIGARSLGGKDLLSKVDPYARAYILNSQQEKITNSQKTKTISKTQNPQWNETFKFMVKEAASDQLVVEIYDADTFSKDDFLGIAHIPLNKVVKGKEQMLSIEIEDPEPKKKKKETKFGTLDIIVKSDEFGIDNEEMSEKKDEQKHYQQLDEENETLKKEIETLKSQLESSKNEVTSLTEKRNKTEENFMALKKEISELKSQVDVLSEENTELKSQYEELASNKEKEIKLVRSESKKSLESLVKLQEEQQVKQQQLQEEKEKLEEEHDELKNKEIEASSWKEKHDHLSQELEAIKKELASKNEDVERLETEKKSSTSEHQEQAKRFENELKNHQTSLEKVNEQNKVLENEKVALKDNYDALQRDHQQLKEQLDKLEQEVASNEAKEESPAPMLTISSPQEERILFLQNQVQELEEEKIELQNRFKIFKEQHSNDQKQADPDNQKLAEVLEKTQDQNVSLTNKLLKMKEEHHEKEEKLKKLVSSLSDAVKSLKQERDQLHRADFNRKLENGELDSDRGDSVDETVANGVSNWTMDSQPDYKKKLSSTREYLDEHRKEDDIDWKDRFEELESEHDVLQKEYERLQDRYEFQAVQMLEMTKQLDMTTTIIGMPSMDNEDADAFDYSEKPTSPTKMVTKSAKLKAKLERVQYQNHLMRQDLIQSDQHLASCEEAWAKERVRYEERIATLRNNLRFASGLQSTSPKRSASTIPPSSVKTPRQLKPKPMTIFDKSAKKKSKSSIVPPNSFGPTSHASVYDVLTPILERRNLKALKQSSKENLEDEDVSSDDQTSMPDIHSRYGSASSTTVQKRRPATKKSKKSKKSKKKSKKSTFAFKARSPYEYFQGEELLLELYNRASASPHKS